MIAQLQRPTVDHHTMRTSTAMRIGGVVSAVVLAATLVACSVSGESATGTTDPLGSKATTSSSTTTTTSKGGQKDDTPVAPARIPPGYEALNAEDVAVGLAVPESWKRIELTADQITANSKAMAEENPELANLAGAASGMLSDAEILAAQGVGAFGRRPIVAVIQSDMTLRSIPASMGDQFAQQFEAVGGKDVTTEMIDVPGLDDGVQALSVSVTMSVAGNDVALHEVIVPTSHGLAIVAMTGTESTVDLITSTIAAV